ncbi:MAG TPA: hypothetical protein GX004_04225 [Firmicutes bacterium]|nr:hypothetical protein [Bacillota bacterium]
MRRKFSGFFRYGTCLLVVSLFLTALLLHFYRFGGSSCGDCPDGDVEDSLPFIARENYEGGELIFEEEKSDPGQLETEDNTGSIMQGELLYLGVYNGKIAVYAEDPSGNKILKEVLPYIVKNVYYDELKRGIPFYGEEGKMKLLEDYTS